MQVRMMPRIGTRPHATFSPTTEQKLASRQGMQDNNRQALAEAAIPVRKNAVCRAVTASLRLLRRVDFFLHDRRYRHLWSKLRLALVPLRCLLKGVRQREHFTFREMRAGNHEANRQAALRKAARKCQRRNAIGIKWRSVAAAQSWI